MGAKVTVGEINYTLKKIGKASFSDGEFGIEFETKDNAIKRVAGVKFLTATGKEIDSSPAGSGSMGFGNDFTYSREYDFEKKPSGKVVMQLELWTGHEEIDLPFDLKAGLGS